MKKLSWLIACLMTMVLSVNAQITTPENIYEDFYDSLAIETTSFHNTISIRYIGQNRFELVCYVIGEGFLGNKTLERSVLLYRGDIDSMVDFFSYILYKSKEWNEICIQNNSPCVNKQIIGISVERNKKNKNYKQLKDWDYKYNVEFGYTGKGDFIVVFDNLVFTKCGFYDEKDLVCILDYIKSSKVNSFVKEQKIEEEKRQKEKEKIKKVLRMLL